MAYVIKMWEASDVPDEKGAYVEIAGRQSGLLSWLLTLIGIAPTVKLVVKESKVEFSQGSLNGFTERIIPASKISSTLYGYIRPWIEMVLIIVSAIIAGAFFAGTVDGTFGGVIIVGGIIFAIIYYALNKAFVVGMVEVSGDHHKIVFKRSVIEGQAISETEGRRVADIIQGLIDKVNTISSPYPAVGQPIPFSPASPAPPQATTDGVVCAACGWTSGLGAKFCKNCGRLIPS